MTAAPQPVSVPSSILQPILADAATRLGVASTALTVLSFEAVTWPDAGLGCPEPGVNYPQVPVDGFRLVLHSAGRLLDYRGRGVGTFRLCSRTLDPIPLPSGVR